MASSILVILFIASINVCLSDDLSTAPVFASHSDSPGTGDCVDLDTRCSAWASQGECQQNAAWMMGNCRRSCKSCQGGNRAWQLRSRIAEGYDNTTKAQNLKTVNIDIASASIDHVEVDESRQLVQMHGKVVMTWNDTRIAWDAHKWGVSWLNFYWIQVWTPDIIQTNAPNAMPGKFERKILASNYTGQIYLWADFSFTVPCKFDHGSYPNDVQRCCATIDDKRYSAVWFNVTEQAKRTLTESLDNTHSPQFNVESADIIASKFSVKMLTDWHKDPLDLEASNCDICVTLRRSSSFYTTEIVGPALATSIITLVSFLMSKPSHQTLMLMVSAALQIASYGLAALKIPSGTEGMPPIYVYFGFNMAMTLLTFVLTTLLAHLKQYRTQIPPPHMLTTMVDIVTKIMPCGCVSEDIDGGDVEAVDAKAMEAGSPTGKTHWAPFATCLRMALLAVLLVLYFIVAVACFLF